MGKRLGIFFFKDESGIVDHYVKYSLQKLKDNTDILVLYSEYHMQIKSFDGVAEICDFLYTGEKNSTVTASYVLQRVLDNLDFWNKSDDFSEIVFMDDSVFGPFYSLDEVLKKFRDKNFDYAGIYKLDERIDEKGDYLPARLEDSFLWIGENIIRSRHLNNFFTKYIEAREGSDLGEVLLDYFSQWEFCCGTYIDSKNIFSGQLNYNIDYNLYGPYQMVAIYKNPFLKCSAFTVRDGIKAGLTDELKRTFEFLKMNGLYPVDYIWEHILRVFSTTDLRWTMHLNYILPMQNECGLNKPFLSAVVFMHLYYKELLQDNLEYVRNIPDDIDVIISTVNDGRMASIHQFMEKIGRKNYLLVEAGTRGRDAAAFLVAGREHLLKYEYICVVHDKKTSGGRGTYMIGDAFQRLIFDNLIASPNYVYQILTLLESEKRLGILAPPIPIMGDYLKYSLGNEWTICYEETVKLARKLGVSVPIDRNKQPFTLSTCFWCKKEALIALLEREWKYEDFPPEPLENDGTINHCMERVLGYIAQEAGFYSAQVMNGEFAEVYSDNAVEILSHIYKAVREYGILDVESDLKRVLEKLNKDELIKVNKELEEKYQWFKNENFKLAKKLVNVEAKYQWFFNEGEDLRKQLVDMGAKYQWFYNESIEYQEKYRKLKEEYDAILMERNELKKRLERGNSID